MNGGGERMQALYQRWRWSVQILVANAIDTAVLHGWSIEPVPRAHNFFQWHAIAGTAPGRDQDIGRGGNDFFDGNLLSRNSNKFPARRFNQFRNPRLRCNEWL